MIRKRLILLLDRLLDKIDPPHPVSHSIHMQIPDEVADRLYQVAVAERAQRQ